MIIGICDDSLMDRNTIYEICRIYLESKQIEHSILLFSSGEEVLEYCLNNDNFRIDLLLLDIEMGGISGVEVKDILLKNSRIWRIAFVSSHVESAIDGYSTKTIGFVPKPIQCEHVHKMLRIVNDDLSEDEVIQINGINGKKINISLSDILYIKADDSYTEIYTYNTLQQIPNYILVAKKIGVIEKVLSEKNFIRVHKSYLVNLVNVEDISSEVIMRDWEETIPIGRKYKETIKKQFYQYAKRMVVRRI